MAAIPGGDIITSILNVISQSLLLPVIIILLLFVIFAVITFGGLISEYTSRKKVPIKTLKELVYNINSSPNIDSLKNIINDADIPKSQKAVLNEIASSKELDTITREAFARRLVEEEEEKTDKILKKTDIITRIGPTLGLMGTLIPLGSGLAALGSGDINTLSQALIVAFDTTVVGIGSGGLCYFISKIRSGWYEEYLSNLDVLTDAMLDYMKSHTI